MANEDDADAAKRIEKGLLGKKLGDGRRSKGNPPAGWKKAHPRPQPKK